MKSEMPPMLNLLEFGEFYPGLLRPLMGVCSSEPPREVGIAALTISAVPSVAYIYIYLLDSAVLESFFGSPAWARIRAVL